MTTPEKIFKGMGPSIEGFPSLPFRVRLEKFYSSFLTSRRTFPCSSFTIMCAAHEYHGSYALSTISIKFNFASSTIFTTVAYLKTTSAACWIAFSMVGTLCVEATIMFALTTIPLSSVS